MDMLEGTGEELERILKQMPKQRFRLIPLPAREEASADQSGETREVRALELEQERGQRAEGPRQHEAPAAPDSRRRSAENAGTVAWPRNPSNPTPFSVRPVTSSSAVKSKCSRGQFS